MSMAGSATARGLELWSVMGAVLLQGFSGCACCYAAGGSTPGAWCPAGLCVPRPESEACRASLHLPSGQRRRPVELASATGYSSRRASNVGAGQMATHSPVPGRAAQLRGRRSEIGVLDRLIGAVRAGQSRALVLVGEAGAGKTALLDHLAGRASGCRVARVAGVQSEMELAFAGVQQLSGPLDERVRERIVAETRGNPLALLELVRGRTPAELAGGFGLAGATPIPGHIEEAFRRRVDALPAGTRHLLQLAAADPVGEPGLVWRGARAPRPRPPAAGAA